MRSVRILLSVVSMSGVAAAQTTISVVSSASGVATVSPESLASAYGRNLTGETQQARGLPLPTALAGISINVTDSTGALRPAPMIYASPTQINFLVPAGTAAGPAKFQAISGAGVVAQGSTEVQATAPGIFAIDGSGTAAAFGVRTVLANGQQSVFPAFQCSGSAPCTPVALTLGVDTPLAVELFGTGIRGSSKVSATIDGQPAQVLFSGPQGDFPGLDQVNLGISLNLRNAGIVPVVVTVDNQPSRPVFISVQ
jgi:uncharacterized protein (TIGR03437 family)